MTGCELTEFKLELYSKPICSLSSNIEIIENKNSDWFLACQFHPEFKSKPDNAHPLFKGFVKAALVNFQKKS